MKQKCNATKRKETQKKRKRTNSKFVFCFALKKKNSSVSAISGFNVIFLDDLRKSLVSCYSRFTATNKRQPISNSQ